MRAAFIAAGWFQVAVVVPTTLLARQHFATFQQRFKGLPSGSASHDQRQDLAAVGGRHRDSTIDIAVGTHALLGKSIAFQRLGLLIVDEEQHFGVAHKERLKQLREDVHVLTLTATPIPRTLQLALSGVRELSLITTPPVDRLAVRTYISPFDPVIIREALRRERYRGGQSFYVVPRISDLEDVAEFLAEQTPELRIGRAHGQLAPSTLEDVMTAFYDGSTMCCCPRRSSGRVSTFPPRPHADRASRRHVWPRPALPAQGPRRPFPDARLRLLHHGQRRELSAGAERRLKGAAVARYAGRGFSLASHDLDIRSAGGLLGEEQSGPYPRGRLRALPVDAGGGGGAQGGDLGRTQDQWSPQISLGAPCSSESYVADLQLRLGLYRRLSLLEKRADIDNFADELVDRFGELPTEVTHLLDVMEIKGLARIAGLAQVDAGPKGAVIGFRKNQFANPEGLVAFMQKSRGNVKMQADHKLVFKADWDLPETRLKGVRALVAQLAEIAGQGKKAA